MGIGQGVRYFRQCTQQSAQLGVRALAKTSFRVQLSNGVKECWSLNERHHEKRAPVAGPIANPHYGDDVRVNELSVDLCFAQKSAPIFGRVCPVAKFFDRDFPIEVVIMSAPDRSGPTLCYPRDKCEF